MCKCFCLHVCLGTMRVLGTPRGQMKTLIPLIGFQFHLPTLEHIPREAHFPFVPSGPLTASQAQSGPSLML